MTRCLKEDNKVDVTVHQYSHQEKQKTTFEGG